MINGVLRLGSSGIYIISRGELAIFIAVSEQKPCTYISLIVSHCPKVLISQRL